MGERTDTERLDWLERPADFDAEKEAGDWVAKWLDGPDLDPEDVVDVYESLKQLLTRCRYETEEECIKDACGFCEIGYVPYRHDDNSGDWVHHDEDDERQLMVCDAFAIHERRRRREEPT